MISNVPNDHYIVMETAYNLLSSQFADEDVAIFLDSDAFPVDHFEPIMYYLFTYNDFVSVFRDEDYLGDDGNFPYPHLCFTAFKKVQKIAIH